ncbi:MAG TPA: hypothetical protein V6D11_32605 [Waterburya sp.]
MGKDPGGVKGVSTKNDAYLERHFCQWLHNVERYSFWATVPEMVALKREYPARFGPGKRSQP